MFFAGCKSKNTVPRGVLSPDKMEAVLWDMMRADQFLAVVRPLPQAERAIVAMGVAALATRAVSRRGRLIKQRPL